MDLELSKSLSKFASFNEEHVASGLTMIFSTLFSYLKGRKENDDLLCLGTRITRPIRTMEEISIINLDTSYLSAGNDRNS